MEKGTSDSAPPVKVDKITIVRRLEQLSTKWKVIAAVVVVIVIVLSAGIYAVSMQSWNGNELWGMVPPIALQPTTTATTWVWTVASIGGAGQVQKSSVYVEVENQLGSFNISADLLSASGTNGFNYTSVAGAGNPYMSDGDTFSLAKATGTSGYGPGSTIFLLTSSGQFAPLLTVPGGTPPSGSPEPIITPGIQLGMQLAWLLIIVAVIVIVPMAIFLFAWIRDRRSFDKATSLILLDLLLYVIVIIGAILTRPLPPESSAPGLLIDFGMMVWILALGIDSFATGFALRAYERQSSKAMVIAIGLTVVAALFIVGLFYSTFAIIHGGVA